MTAGGQVAGGRTVAVTGAEGHLGRRVVDLLAADPTVERVVAIDVVDPTGLRRRGVVRCRTDVRDPAIAEDLAGCDTLVHLASATDPARDEARLRAVNVGGTRNVVDAAHRAGVRKVIYASSTLVYGAHPDNPVPIDESQPLRPNAPFSFAEHKAEVERWLAPWAEQHDDVVVTVLRPSVVAGPEVSNFVSRQLDAPRFTAVRGHKPPMQFVHIDDVASAVVHAVQRDLPGAFNVSSVGWLSFDEVTAISGRSVVEVPEEVAFALTDRLWRLGVGEAPAGQVPYFMHPWVVSVDALVATGWHPSRSNRDALAELAAEHADHVVLGPLHARRSHLRIGAAVTGVAAAAAAAAVVRRRARTRRR